MDLKFLTERVTEKTLPCAHQGSVKATLLAQELWTGMGLAG